MVSVSIPDASQRQQALDPHYSFIVQAPAGSGKTELLTQRFLVLLAQVAAPEEIIAITFTRKAAAEMRARILAALNAAAHEAPPESQHALQTWQLAKMALAKSTTEQWDLLENPNRLRIQTIDSLCAYLTRQMPVVSRFGAAPTITELPHTLYAQAARNILSSLEHEEPWTPALEKLLIYLDNDHKKVEQLLIDMLARRDQWLAHIFDPQLRRERLEQALQHVITDNLAKLKVALPQQYNNEILALIHFAIAHLPPDAPLQAWREKNQLPGTALADQLYWSSLAKLFLKQDGQWRKKLTKEEGFPAPSNAANKTDKAIYAEMKKRMEDLLEQLSAYENFRAVLYQVLKAPPAHYSNAQWQILNSLLTLLPIAVAELHLSFQLHGQVDYTEIATAALQALGDPAAPTDLALALDYRIQHLLVDEFQDTSASQFRLLELLTAGWQPDDGRTLFLVGDPMQSIYRFRKAEVGLFLRAWEEGLGTIPLQPLTLQTNFRSTQGIVNWVNQTFQQVMPIQADIGAGAVPYSPSHAIHPTKIVESVITYPFINSGAKEEAEKIVTIIHHIQQHAPEETIAILVRAKSHLHEIIPALQKNNISYQAIELEMLADRPLIQDLLALTRALLHPADRIAWLAILRAPWCGLLLQDIHAIAGFAHHQTVWERLQDLSQLPLSADGQQRLARFIPVIHERLMQRRRLPLQLWIESAWLALGGPACLTHLKELNDAKVFFNLLEQLQQGEDIIDFAGLVDRLANLAAAPDTQPETTLQIMTIHKSKGLEFDHILLPSLERSAKRDDTPLLISLEKPRSRNETDLLLAPIKQPGANSDPLFDYLRNEENQKANYETGRLLYVAVTRAKKSLHLLGTIKANKNPSSGSLLAQLWPTLAIHFQSHESDDNIAKEEDQTSHPPIHLPLRRLTTNWIPPVNPIGNFIPHLHQNNAPTTLTETDLVNLINPYAKDGHLKHIGTLIHRVLRQIACDGIEQWTTAKIQSQKPYWRSSLIYLGIIPEQLNDSIELVEKAIIKTIQDSKGRWVLSQHHQDTQAEYPLTAAVDGKVVRIIVDRTFIDEQGIRWIIDYKTSDYHDTDLESFLKTEQKVYQPQLEFYGKIFKLKEDLPIRYGLYFPLLNAWREWTADF